MNSELNNAGILLTSVQALIEDQTAVYSTEAWQKVTDLLADLTQLEQLMDYEENCFRTHNCDHDHA